MSSSEEAVDFVRKVYKDQWGKSGETTVKVNNELSLSFKSRADSYKVYSSTFLSSFEQEIRFPYFKLMLISYGVAENSKVFNNISSLTEEEVRKYATR